MKKITDDCLRVARAALCTGHDAAQAVFEHTLYECNRRYGQARAIAGYFADLLPNHTGLLTQCFAESNIGFIFKEIAARNMDIKIFCPETRPFLQGARLTASVAYEQGMDVTLITDNMPAALMQQSKIQTFTAAADAICMDGNVINKVGTLGIALCAKHFGVPVYITGNPDLMHPGACGIEIELRNPEEVLYTQGVRSAMDGVLGYYPAFDITPPCFITGIITDKGVFSPEDLAQYQHK